MWMNIGNFLCLKQSNNNYSKKKHQDKKNKQQIELQSVNDFKY